jgi:ribosomal protein S18 acetylase RimI-like enzyme
VTIRKSRGADAEVRALMTALWGSTDVALDGKLYDLTACDCLLCEEGEELLGFLHYDARGEAWEILALDCPRPGVGAGTALIEEVKIMARAAGAKTLIVVTTNDNAAAMRFYQKRGFVLTDVRFGAVARSREIKSAIPDRGEDGIPILHEMVFEMEI